MYVPNATEQMYPKPLQSLYDPVYAKMEFNDLIKACQSVDITITEAMAAEIEKLTIHQFRSALWHKYRAGRVTASQMKAVCQSNSLNPSSVLVKKICYPESFSFQSKATEWGNKMEKPA